MEAQMSVKEGQRSGEPRGKAAVMDLYTRRVGGIEGEALQGILCICLLLVRIKRKI